MAKLHIDESEIRTPQRPRRQKYSREARRVAAEFGLYPCLRCGIEYQLTKQQYETGKVCSRCYKGR